MPIENQFNYIDDLDASFPETTDELSQADDHMRGTKKATKGSFPNLGSEAVSLTAAEINALPTDISSLILVPVGAVVMFTGLISNLPVAWAFCDGTNGTVDLRDRFIFSSTDQNDVGDTGGTKDSVNISHSHTANHDHPSFNTSSSGGHIHQIPRGSGAGGTQAVEEFNGGTASSTNTTGTGNHVHSINVPNLNVTTSTAGISGTDKNMPPFYKLAYIQRIA